MKETTILMSVLFLFNIGVQIYINIRNKKKLKQENLENNEQARKVEFNSEFFGLAFIPTSMLIVVVADEFYKFIVIFAYFIAIVFIADKVYKKHLNRKTNN